MKKDFISLRWWKKSIKWNVTMEAQMHIFALTGRGNLLEEDACPSPKCCCPKLPIFSSFWFLQDFVFSLPPVEGLAQ